MLVNQSREFAVYVYQFPAFRGTWHLDLKGLRCIVSVLINSCVPSYKPKGSIFISQHHSAKHKREIGAGEALLMVAPSSQVISTVTIHTKRKLTAMYTPYIYNGT